MDAARAHTLVFSDIHLTTAELQDPERPLWKRYKHADLFVDDSIARMLAHARASVLGRLEVVLDGDVFDFDAVTQIPDPAPFAVNWLERIRGLDASEPKSAWKMAAILDDHPVFVDALKELLTLGHRVVFVVGNHDMELLWPAVQEVLRERLSVPMPHDLRICEFFYVSEGDTLIEHGNQYDAYCLCQDPVFPTIAMPPTGEPRMRLAFGNYAARYMINGMGFINPHVSSAWLMSAWEWLVFFYKHVARSQPLLVWTWLWGAAAAFLVSLRDGLLPAETDVMVIDDRVDAIADRANSSPRTVRGLLALKVHPAIYFPWKIARELWLDRVGFLLLLIGATFQLHAMLNLFTPVSVFWWFVLILLVLPMFVFYARSIQSDVDNLERVLRQRVEVVGRLARVDRVILGHTHRERHTQLDGVEVLNAGSWSPAFRDVACTEPFGRRCVAWVRPGPDGRRVGSVEAWTDAGFLPLPFEVAHPIPMLPLGMLAGEGLLGPQKADRDAS